MLKAIDPILGPELLAILRAMGHGDRIAIVDANFPASSAGPRLVRMDGLDAVRVLDAVLSLLPLDDFVPDPAIHMQVVGDPGRVEPIFDAFRSVLHRRQPGVGLTGVERYAFYDRVRTAYAVVATGEARLYGNILLTKGVICPEAAR